MRTTCDFCYRHCSIPDGMTGWCGSRIAEDGIVHDTAYGQLAAIADDPIEKKPLYHFLPGTRTLSIAMEGCSLDCDFCQNYRIAKEQHVGLERYAPDYIAEFAADNDFPSISFTYTEPIVWQDYMIDVASAAGERSVRTAMVSNGTFSIESLERILPVIDAYNIDLKGDEEFYRSICHGSITPVLDGIERIVEYGAHLEVTTLVIEGIHTKAMIHEIGSMLKSRGVNVWHITPFYPMRRMSDRNPTSAAFLNAMAEEATESGIPHIYALDSTIHCPECGTSVARKESTGICPSCGRAIYGIWE